MMVFFSLGVRKDGVYEGGVIFVVYEEEKKIWHFIFFSSLTPAGDASRIGQIFCFHSWATKEMFVFSKLVYESSEPFYCSFVLNGSIKTLFCPFGL